ncbi:FG-GAP-like repeat-containing protein, partial [Chloroflexota bacterium]
MKKLFVILALLALLVQLSPGGLFLADSVEAQEPDTSLKVSSLLALQVQDKLRAIEARGVPVFPEESQQTGQLGILQGQDIGLESLDKQRIFIHFTQKPTQSQIVELEAVGITPYLDSWIPPLENHPTGFILADMPIDKLQILAQKGYVIRLETAERMLEPQNDLATQKINADDVWGSGYNGTGVRVAVLDSGLDVTHPDIPTPVISKDYSNYPALDDIVSNNITGHGTHVTGSVLGRGTQSGGVYKGSAPGADLIFLKIGDDTTSMASTAAMVNAIKDATDNYSADIITMSYGGWYNFHDGSSEEAQAVDYAVSQGAVVLISAGNDADLGWHYSGNVSASSTTGYIQVNVTGAAANTTSLSFNLVWYDGTGISNDLELEYYNSISTLLSSTNFAQSQSSRGTESEWSYADDYVASGNSTYYLRVKNNSSNSQFFHIYYSPYYNLPGYGPVTFQSADPNYTIGTPADADSAIAVGAYNTRQTWYDYANNSWWSPDDPVDQISSFSSRGPRVDTGASPKPNITAPGSMIISVRDNDVYPWPGGANPYYVDNESPNENDVGKNNGLGPADYYVMRGTSMACPLAAGVAALILEKNPDWTPAQVKHALEFTSTEKGATGHDDLYGWGLVDAQAAVLSLSVSTRTPAANALDIIKTSDIEVHFNNSINGTTVNENTFSVDGSISGKVSGTYSGGGTANITFNPSSDFKVGETITVTLTTGIQGVGGGTLSNTITWQFVVDVPDGYAYFANNGQTLGNSLTYGVSLGDVDGDGDLDAFATNYSQGNKVWLNNGSGNFTDSGQSLGSLLSYDVSLEDLDGDGDLDAFVSNNAQADKVWLNNGSGNFTDSGQSLGSSNSRVVSLGDVDGDGDLDTFVSNGSNQANKVWLNNGSGNFTDSGQSLGSSTTYGVSLGDVDGDGDLDAFTTNYAQGNNVWLNNGSGNFTDSGQSLGSANSYTSSLKDLDGDGDLDAFVANYLGDANKVWLNNGSGNFTDSGQSLGSSDSFGVAMGDFDGDGNLDAFVANYNNQANKVWLNDGSGNFTDSGQSLGSSTSSDVGLGDINGDGDLDAFVANYSGQPNRVWLNIPPSLSISSRAPPVNTLDVNKSANIIVQFNTYISGSTANADTFNVDGSMSGNIPGSYSGGGTDTITFNPDSDFKAGETVTVTLTTGIEGEGSTTLVSTVTWQFVVEAPQGHAYFEDSGLPLGSSESFDVALGDVDGDGDLDAFVTNRNQGNRVWLNSGGNFTDTGQSLGSSQSRGVALGDVDGDGNLDAFEANDAGQANKVWLNNGSGNFTDSGLSLGSSNSKEIVLGDVDGDGDLDVFVANFDPNKVWLNNGSGNFTDSGQALGTSNSWSIALGDIDGDGDLDAFIANGSGQANKVWLNDGGGNFTDSGLSLGSSYSGDVALGDVDGDGTLDAFVANGGGGGSPNKVWLNNGSGSFTDSGQAMGSEDSVGASLGDLDGDGDLDAFVTNDGGGEPNKVRLNDGNGNFNITEQSLGSSVSKEIALGDIDGDGDLDAFVANEVFGVGSPNKVWLNTTPITILSKIPAANAIAVATSSNITVRFSASINGTTVNGNTFNVDGSMSGNVSGSYFGGGTSNITFNPDSDFKVGETITVTLTTGIRSTGNTTLLNTVTWQFIVEVPQGYAYFEDSGQALGSSEGFDVALGDVDGDGDLDAFVTNRNQGNRVWRNNGSGNFTDSGLSLGSTQSRGVALGDIDGDGDLDAFEANDAGQANKVWLNNGSGNFTDSGLALGSSNSKEIVLGDVDGDGDLDVFVANFDPNKVWLNNGSGNFTDSGQALGTSNSWNVALGDIDDDGDLDAFIANGSSQANKVWLNDGGGSFTDSGQAMGSEYSEDVALGDVDGDGDLDAFIANGGVGLPNEVWLNNGSGNFTDSGQAMGSENSVGASLGDIDSDGDLDAFVANEGEPNKVWLNNGSGNFSNNGQSLGSSVSKEIALGDIDGDGDLDAFVANEVFGVGSPNKVWLNTPLPVTVSSKTPATNTLDVVRDSNIVVQFSASISGTTVNGTTFIVDGSMSGNVSGTYTGGGTANITFNPSSDFKVGETITVTITTGIQSTDGGILINPITWQFVVEVTDGSANFTDTGQSLGNKYSESAALGDVDGDGDLDAFVANTASSGTNKVWLNDGSGNFTDSGQSLGDSYSYDVALGDVDGDGDLDALVANYDSEANIVWLNDGSGNFTDSGQLLGNLHSTGVRLGDIDSDGDLDALTSNFLNEGNRVYFNDGSGNFTDSNQSLGTASSQHVELGDFDGDGDLDAFVANNGANKVYLNNGSGNFTDSAQSLGTDDNSWVSLGDVDDDGDLDAFVAEPFFSPSEVWLNNGSGNFTDSGQSLGSGNKTSCIQLGDLDDDGDLDAFFANNIDGLNNPVPNTVFLNDGSGNFTDSGLLLGNSRSYCVALGDLNGDGCLDAFVANYLTLPNTVWLNVPALVAETSLAQGLSSNVADVLVVDVNIDRIKNPSDNSTANITGGIGSYTA